MTGRVFWPTHSVTMPGTMPPSARKTQLLETFNREIAERLKAGESVPSSSEGASTLPLPWEPEHLDAIRTAISTWLREDKENELVELLRRDLTAIAYPAVFRQILYLASLVRLDEDDRPSETRREATAFLADLLSAWVAALIPGYTLVPIPFTKRRGRPRIYDEELRFRVLEEFQNLRAVLDEIEGAGPAEIAPKKSESRPQFLRRMEGVVQSVNKHTVEYWALSRLRPAKETKRTVLREKPPVLSKKVLSQIVWQAVHAQRVSKNTLLYGILAHHYLRDCRQVESMRGLIEHAEPDYPEFDSRKSSRSPS